MNEFFAKYGVKDKREFDEKVRGDGTFAARIAEDFFDLVVPVVVASAEENEALGAEAEPDSVETVEYESEAQYNDGGEKLDSDGLPDGEHLA